MAIRTPAPGDLPCCGLRSPSRILRRVVWPEPLGPGSCPPCRRGGSRWRTLPRSFDRQRRAKLILWASATSLPLRSASWIVSRILPACSCRRSRSWRICIAPAPCSSFRVRRASIPCRTQVSSRTSFLSNSRRCLSPRPPQRGLPAFEGTYRNRRETISGGRGRFRRCGSPAAEETPGHGSRTSMFLRTSAENPRARGWC